MSGNYATAALAALNVVQTVLLAWIAARYHTAGKA